MQKSSAWVKGPWVASQAHQLDEVLSHSEVVLVDRMDHSINERLLVVVAQLRHIAKVNIRDPPISQRKNVSCSGDTSAKKMQRTIASSRGGAIKQSAGLWMATRGLAAMSCQYGLNVIS